MSFQAIHKLKSLAQYTPDLFLRGQIEQWINDYIDQASIEITEAQADIERLRHEKDIQFESALTLGSVQKEDMRKLEADNARLQKLFDDAYVLLCIRDAEILRLNRVILKEITENDELGCEYTYVNILRNLSLIHI
jgi:hypothetical protein